MWYCMILLLKYVSSVFWYSQYCSRGSVSVSVNEHSHSVKYCQPPPAWKYYLSFTPYGWRQIWCYKEISKWILPFKLRPSWSTCVIGWFWITYNPQHDLLKRLTYSHIQSSISQSYPLTKSAIFLSWDPIGCSIRAIWHTWWFSLSQ